MANIGYPIVEAEPDGTFCVTKHAAAGGRVTLDSVKEQLLYELGDPKNYITPDCVADFTSVRLAADGDNRVRVTGIRGGPRPPSLKLSISYANGWKAIGTLVYSWPQALEKAQAADRIVRQRLRNLGLAFDEIYTEYFGVNACHGAVAPPNADPPEVQLRIGVRGADKKAVDRFTRELIPLVLNGPPGATGFGEGRPWCARSWPTGRRCRAARRDCDARGSGGVSELRGQRSRRCPAGGFALLKGAVTMNAATGICPREGPPENSRPAAEVWGLRAMGIARGPP